MTRDEAVERVRSMEAVCRASANELQEDLGKDNPFVEQDFLDAEALETALAELKTAKSDHAAMEAKVAFLQEELRRARGQLMALTPSIFRTPSDKVAWQAGTDCLCGEATEKGGET
jgi:hypothetical protein